MNANQRRCLQLMDETDVAVSRSRLSRKEGFRCIVSRSRRHAPRSSSFIKMKIHLLEALRNTFIEQTTRSVRLSALLTFCFHNGFELVSHRSFPHIRVGFVLRTSAFDICVVV